MTCEGVFLVNTRAELGPGIGGFHVAQQAVTLDQGAASLFGGVLIAAARGGEIAAHRRNRGLEVGERGNRATSALAKRFAAQHRGALFEPYHELAHLFWRSGRSQELLDAL